MLKFPARRARLEKVSGETKEHKDQLFWYIYFTILNWIIMYLLKRHYNIDYVFQCFYSLNNNKYY